ncbi:MAG TPA: glycosyltransferase [Armatimonadota bacterium]|nr:glycosyltransferase [Armatimonadota bacterium]
MRILDFITHPPFQSELCKTGHEFVLAASECWDHWDVSLRPLPGNASVVSEIDPEGLDLAIVATREQYVRAARLDIPVILLSHTIMHPWDREFFAALPDHVERVYVSDHKRAAFGDLGQRGRTIRLAADADEDFTGYSGADARILNVTNRFSQQGDRGYDLYRRLTEGLPVQVIGHHNDPIPGARAATDLDDLRQLYRTNRAYLNTDPQGRLHLATLEAMATGMPLVSPPIAELMPYVDDGVNAFVSTDEGALRDALEELLEDEELAQRVGEAGRAIVRTHFGIDRFLREWSEAIGDVADRRGKSAGRGSPLRPRRAGDDSGLRVAINVGLLGTIKTGIGQHAANLVEGLAATDGPNSYHLIVGTSSVDKLPTGHNLHPLLVRSGDEMWEETGLPSVLEECRADVYHSPAFGIPIVKPCPCVATVHDCIPKLFPEHAPPFLRRFFDDWAPTWMKLADHLIAVSEHTKHDIAHLYGVSEDKITVIYQASPSRRRVDDEEAISDVKRRLGIPGPYVLYVGRIELRKNIAGMIDAFRLLRARGDFDGTLVLAGPRDPEPHDPEGVLPPEGEYGDIIVPGFVAEDDLSGLYSGAQAFCFPSFYEGFGLPVLEALACGVPVVTSNVSSLPEVGGDAAIYVNPHDIEDMADGMSRAISDTQLRGGAGPARARAS